MVDLGDKGSTEYEQEMSSSTSSSNCRGVTNSNEGGKMKTCADCGTKKTPLWRTGPSGPKSLCNACGIRSRKKRRALLGLSKSSTEHKKPKKINTNRVISANTDSVKSKLLAFRVPMTWQKTKIRRTLGEEERAAMLLMALSCGSVY